MAVGHKAATLGHEPGRQRCSLLKFTFGNDKLPIEVGSKIALGTLVETKRLLNPPAVPRRDKFRLRPRQWPSPGLGEFMLQLKGCLVGTSRSTTVCAKLAE
eukprot:5362974-Amphidinium_carterae.1